MSMESLSDSAQRVWRYIQERQWQPELDLDRGGRPFPSAPEEAQQFTRRNSGVRNSTTPHRRGIESRRWPQSQRHSSWPRNEGVGDSGTERRSASFFRAYQTSCSGGSVDPPSGFASRHGDRTADHRGASAGQTRSRPVSGWDGFSTPHSEPRRRPSHPGTQLDDAGPGWQLGAPRHASTPASVAPPSFADDIISASQSQLRRFPRRRRPPARSEAPLAASSPQQPAQATATEAPPKDPASRASRSAPFRDSAPAAAISRPQGVSNSADCPLATEAPTSDTYETQAASERARPAGPVAGRTRRKPAGPREMPRFSLLSPFGLGDSALPAGGTGSSAQAPAGAEPQPELSEEVPSVSDPAHLQRSTASRVQSSGVSEHARGGGDRVGKVSASPSFSVSEQASVPDRQSAAMCDGTRVAREQQIDCGQEADEQEQMFVSQSTVCGEVDRLIDNAVPFPHIPPGTPQRSPGTPQRSPGTPPRAALEAPKPRQCTPERVPVVPTQQSATERTGAVSTKVGSNKANMSKVSPVMPRSNMGRSETSKISRWSGGNSVVHANNIERAVNGKLCGSPSSSPKDTQGEGGSTTVRLNTRISTLTRRSPNCGEEASVKTKSSRSHPASNDTATKSPSFGIGRRADTSRSPSAVSKTVPKSPSSGGGRRADTSRSPSAVSKTVTKGPSSGGGRRADTSRSPSAASKTVTKSPASGIGRRADTSRSNEIEAGVFGTVSPASAANETATKTPASDVGRRPDQDDAQLMRPPLHPVFRGRRARLSRPAAAPEGDPRSVSGGRTQPHSSSSLQQCDATSAPGSDRRGQKRPAPQTAAAAAAGKRPFTAALQPAAAGDPAVTSLTGEHAEAVARAVQDPAVTCVGLCLEFEDGGSQLRPATEGRPAAERALVAAVTGGPLAGRTLRLQPGDLPGDAAASLAAALLSGPGRRVCCGARQLLLFALRRCGVPVEVGLRCWRLRDLAVADWLLGPDRPARRFPALLAELGGQLGAAAARDAALSRQQQLATDARQLDAADAAVTRRLLSARLLTLFERVETPLAAVLAAMEARGVRVDVARLHAAAAACQLRLRWLEAAAHRAAGTVFSLASPSQLRRLLYDQLRLDARAGVTVPLTERGLKSTGEQALQRLSGTHPLPALLLQHRRVLKLKSTYVDGVLGQVRGGAVFPHWLQTAAATGRVQAAAPNLQSVPKRPLSLLDDAEPGDQKTILARAPFVARSGQALLAVDFCQMELRLLAHLSRDGHLTDAIRHAPGGDIFRQLTAVWTARPAAAVSDAQRESTKRLVYAAMYGAGRERLAEVLECAPQQAQEALDSFLASCPAISSFSRRVVADCRRDGFVTSLLGRRRWVAAITSSQQQARSQAERQAVNFSIQGSAADLCKLVMLAVTEAAPDVPLLAQLHDELLWEVPRARLAEFRTLVERQVGRLDALLSAAGHPDRLLVPLPVSVSSGDCWAAMDVLQSADGGGDDRETTETTEGRPRDDPGIATD